MRTVAPGDVVFCGNSAPCGICRQCTRGRESLCEDLLYVLGGLRREAARARADRTREPAPAAAGLPLSLAPLAEPLACAVHAIDVYEGRPGDRLTILGAGSLGLMLCALVASAGGWPVVLDPHPERLQLARRFGAAETIRATKGPEDVERAGGADLVIEAVGRPEAWELAVAMAAPGGTVNLFGGCARDTTFTIPTARIHYEQVTCSAPTTTRRATSRGRWPCSPPVSTRGRSCSGRRSRSRSCRPRSPPSPPKYAVRP